MASMNAEACVASDVVFIGASVSNLLSAVALLERFEGIRIKILEASSRLESVGAFITAISSEAWGLLSEVSPCVSNSLQRRTEGKCITADVLCDLLLSKLPDGVICLNQPVKEIKETTDLVHFRTEDGLLHETKLLIVDGRIKGRCSSVGESLSGFFEVTFTTSSMALDARKIWTCADLYVGQEVRSGSHAFSCILKANNVSMERVREQLHKIPELAEVLSGNELTSFFSRPLLNGRDSQSLGRMATSGVLSATIPYISPVKMESELEEALLLCNAVSQKGLTAAALFDWRRRQAASSRMQTLKKMKSPIELLSNGQDKRSGDKSSKIHAASSSTPKETCLQTSDCGKPLVCTNFKPYTAMLFD